MNEDRFLVLLWFIISRIVNKFEKMDQFGTLHVCSFEMI